MNQKYVNYFSSQPALFRSHNFVSYAAEHKINDLQRARELKLDEPSSHHFPYIISFVSPKYSESVNHDSHMNHAQN
jgi:hypothetical protein